MATQLQTESKTPISKAFTPAPAGILQRKCACGSHAMVGGECAECAKKKDMLQRKLTIGASSDPLEQEADRVADQVMSMPLNSKVNPTPPRIQRFSGQATNVGLDTAPPSVDRVLSSPGTPLEPSLRQDMEARFGNDFTQVRVHTGSAAEQSAREVNAQAYTVGSNIVFGAGRFWPRTNEGRRLIAHELTHVLQQSYNSHNSAQTDQSYKKDNFDTKGGTAKASFFFEKGESFPILSHLDSKSLLQRQQVSTSETERINRLNFDYYEAVRQERWEQAAVILNGFNEHDIEIKLRQLGASQLFSMRNGAIQSMPGWSQRVLEPIERLVRESTMLPLGSSPGRAENFPLTEPRPSPLPIQQAFTLYQIIDMDSGTASRIPEGRIVTVALPPVGQVPNRGFRTGDITSPFNGTSLSVLTNINRSLMRSGFGNIPGGNGIGLIGIPRMGTPGAIVPESLSQWGHTAVYARINGQIVVTRGYTVGSLAEAALRGSGITAGREAIPGVISNDVALFTNTGARVIEFPVSAQTASGFVERLPMPGPPPPEGPTLYTGRPSIYGSPAATNCVGWGCAVIESELGGRVGTITPEGNVSPIAEPVNPQQGLQGRFMQATSEGAEIAQLPGATGEAVISGMPRYLQILKWGGRIFIVIGGVMVVVETSRAREGQRGRTLTGATGGFLGGLAAGAAAGLVCGPSALACSIVLGLGFGLAGYFGGRALAEAAYDSATTQSR
jgi:hypothetical protein